jgi:DNA modification methylase
MLDDGVHLGDCLDLLKDIDDNSIDLSVTSPPYAVAKFYERKRSGKSFIWRAVWLSYQVFKQYRRIIKPGGYVVWNFGDSGMGKRALNTEVTTTIPMSIWYWLIGRKTGFELQATRIWYKNFPAVSKSFVSQREPRPCFDYEHIWTFRKPGPVPQKVNVYPASLRGVWADNDAKLFERLQIDKGHRLQAAHGADFPEYIPALAILVYSDPGNVVLDPFGGTGTTGLSAIKTGRRYILIEKDETFCKFAKDRLELATRQYILPMEILSDTIEA